MKKFLYVLSCLFVVACSSPHIKTSPTAWPWVDRSNSEIVSKIDYSDSGKVIIIGDIDDTLLAPVIKKFDERAAAGDKEILFRINSFGGVIFSGLDFIQHIEDSKKKYGIRTKCYVDTRAYSMGAVILESAVCDERYMTKRSSLLFHQASTGAEGNPNDVKEALDFLKILTKNLEEICAERMGMKLQDFHAKQALSAWILDWEEALAVKAIDGVVSASDIPEPYTLEEPKSPLHFLLQ